MDISKKQQKISKKDKIKIKGPLDQFITKEKLEDSLTLSDFDSDLVDLDLSHIVNQIVA